MATRRRPAVKKIKFELTRSAIAGIGVVCFCIFLWMFLFGVWAGQSLLLPSAAKERLVVQQPAPIIQTPKAVLRIEAQNKKKVFKEQ